MEDPKYIFILIQKIWCGSTKKHYPALGLYHPHKSQKVEISGAS